MKKFLTFLMTAILTLGVFTMSACGGNTEKGVFLLSLSDDVMNSFIADNKIDGKYDVYGKVDITNDQYKFIDASSPVKTLGVSATYIVSNDLSEDVVYNITKAMWESKGSIGHTVESTMDINLALVTIGNVKIHPGAAKYYREKGLTIADDRIASCGTATSDITIYTGGTGGTYYAFTNGLQSQLKDKTAYNYTVVGDTGGSVANLKAIKNGNCNMAIVQNDTMVNAYNGLTNNFAESGAITNFSVIGEVYPEVMQIVTNDSSIKSLADLKGSKKIVSIGDVGSGVEANAVALLKKYGVDITYNESTKTYTSKDISIKNLSVAKSADGMKDEVVDVFFFTSGAPATSITELATALNK